jgi:hypothetical protein
MRDDTWDAWVMRSTPVTAVVVHRDGRRERRRSYVVHTPGAVPPDELTVRCLKECCAPAGESA